MALVVALNTSYAGERFFEYYDPLTGIRLTEDAPQSADLSSHTGAQLHNIIGAVNDGRLVLVSGYLPTKSQEDNPTPFVDGLVPASVWAQTGYLGDPARVQLYLECDVIADISIQMSPDGINWFAATYYDAQTLATPISLSATGSSFEATLNPANYFRVSPSATATLFGIVQIHE